MNLTVNGDTFITEVSTVADLLKELAIDPVRVAVEVNLSIIKKAEYASYNLKDGDTVEMVNFVGGG
ncbi:MAG: sulfur carrier protein ThiS [Thermodesulfovibrionales bacterium]|nr:sulfur carrier protein ThiS [Thermodesulfovibrionales bacterium]